MRLAIPLPFGEIEVNVRKSRRARPLFWYGLLSIALHFAWIAIIGILVARTFLPVTTSTQQPPMMVTISSAPRIQPQPRAVTANHLLVRHQPVLRQAARAQYTPPTHPRRELSKPARVAYVTPRAISQSQIQAQTRMFERTIAQAKAANNPVAGASNNSLTPAATKRYAMNLQGQFGKPQPEGVLYPSKRWVDGPYVYYYVTYTAVYADGTTESGVVPWPIRFSLGEDPFARGIHRMPLPGPLPDYVLPAGVAMRPLVKNCFDHRYPYCPIEHE
jgi:hypothetical protein